MRATSCSGGQWYFVAALCVLLLVPAAFLLWAVWFVVRQVYYRKVIAFERFDRQSRVEAATGLRAALRRRRGQSCCAFLAALSVAWADFTQAAWTLGEWKGNPRFLGMYGALFGDYDDTHACYIGLELARKPRLAISPPYLPHISHISPPYLPGQEARPRPLPRRPALVGRPAALWRLLAAG